MSIYILTGQSIKDIAGPSLLLSAIVAATAAGLSGKALILYRVPSGILHNYWFLYNVNKYVLSITPLHVIHT